MQRTVRRRSIYRASSGLVLFSLARVIRVASRVFLGPTGRDGQRLEARRTLVEQGCNGEQCHHRRDRENLRHGGVALRVSIVSTRFIYWSQSGILRLSDTPTTRPKAPRRPARQSGKFGLGGHHTVEPPSGIVLTQTGGIAVAHRSPLLVGFHSPGYCGAKPGCAYAEFASAARAWINATYA